VATVSEAEVFISYSHRDNVAPFEGEPGWVQEFERALKTFLTEVLGREPAIFRDTKLPRDQPFPDVLVERLTSVKAFVCVMSPNYVNSEWCGRELSTFLEEAKAEGGPTSILKVVKVPVELPDQPDAIRDLLGFELFRVDPDNEMFVPMSPAMDPSTKTDYVKKLYEICQTMSKVLVHEREGAGSEPPRATEVTDLSAGKIFLAETTFDLKRQHSDLKRDLVRHGYQVVPDRNPPYLASELETFVREQLAGCRLSVHLIGHSYGMVPEGASESIVKLQNTLAVDFSQSAPLRRVLWIGGNGGAADERQGKFIAELREDNRAHEGADLLEGSFEEVKTVIYRRLAPEPESSPGGDPGSETQRVYVVCDQADERDGERACQSLEDYLYAVGFEVIPSEFGADPKEWLTDHLETLASSDGVLIYHGAGNTFWLRKMTRYVDQVKGYGRKRPLLATAVYLAPPLTPDKQRYRTRVAIVLTESGPRDPKILDEFVREIQHGRVRLTG
jgi:hypothetical protein